MKGITRSENPTKEDSWSDGRLGRMKRTEKPMMSPPGGNMMMRNGKGLSQTAAAPRSACTDSCRSAPSRSLGCLRRMSMMV